MSDNQQAPQRPSVRERVQQHKGKIGLALLGTMVGVMALGAMSGNQDKKNVQMRADAVDSGRAADATDPAHLQAIKEYDEQRAAAASAAGASHMDTLTAKTASAAADPFAASQPQQPTAASSPSPDGGYPPPQPVQPVVQTQTVEIIKEVQVPVVAPYDWTQDSSLLTYFVNGQPTGGNYAQPAVQQQAQQGQQRQDGFGFVQNASHKQAQQQQAQAVPSNHQQAGVVPQQTAAAQDRQPAPPENQITLIRVGDLSPASLQTPIVSTEQSVVRARVVSGPLKGAILTGQFQQGQNSVAVTFNRMTLPNVPNSITINAVALDYKKASTALATSVNRHIPERFLGTLISAFGNRYAQALAGNNNVSSTRTVINEATGQATQISDSGTRRKTSKEILREAGADSVAQTTAMLNELIPQTPTVKVKRDLEIAVYFMEDLNVDAQTADLINFNHVYK
ncbi:DotG/IcmE/VirB10 family protein [Conchiformibius steedae]|uniref:DotG/IcmE/VirB10 family protein n=1 Tax=Conchiformibius steedae TaxID=153493 RepID=UPI0026EC59C2|nr:DotG/IcmE/VirB10 family protein [Conchiformibius steedae]